MAMHPMAQGPYDDPSELMMLVAGTMNPTAKIDPHPSV